MHRLRVSAVLAAMLWGQAVTGLYNPVHTVPKGVIVRAEKNGRHASDERR